MMTLWTGFKQQNFASDNKIGPNEQEDQEKIFGALLAKINGKRPVGRPQTRWDDYIENFGWNRLGITLKVK